MKHAVAWCTDSKVSLLLACREKKKRLAAEEQLGAATAKAASDAGRWREEVGLKQARIDMLVAGDRAREADFMTQRVKELQVTIFDMCLFHPCLAPPPPPLPGPPLARPPPHPWPPTLLSPTLPPPPPPLQPSPRPCPACTWRLPHKDHKQFF